MSDKPPVAVPAWVFGTGKYIGVVAPMLFAGYLSFHDLKQDFALEQAKVVALEAKVDEEIEELSDLATERREKQKLIQQNLEYISSTVGKLEKTLDDIAEKL